MSINVLEALLNDLDERAYVISAFINPNTANLNITFTLEGETGNIRHLELASRISTSDIVTTYKAHLDKICPKVEIPSMRFTLTTAQKRMMCLDFADKVYCAWTETPEVNTNFSVAVSRFLAAPMQFLEKAGVDLVIAMLVLRQPHKRSSCE